MPPLDALGLLDAIRRDLPDWTVPGPHLHPPRAISPIRLPGGQLLQLPSPGSLGLGLGSAPVSRLWPFHVREAGVGFNAVAVSPPFSGPARLLDMMIWWSVQGGAPNPFFQLLVATDSGGGGGNQADPIGTIGTCVWESPGITDDSGSTFTTERSLPDLTTVISANFPWRFPLGKDVTAPLFFLKARLNAQNLGASTVNGVVRLVEGFDPLTCGCPQ